MGEVRLYQRGAASSEVGRVAPEPSMRGDSFGRALALDGERLVVGAPLEPAHDDTNAAGAVRVYALSRL